jgi:flagellar biosynthesis/type III secretory pathway chaperone
MQPVIELIKIELGKEVQGFRDLLEVVEEERNILLTGKHERLLETSERKLSLSNNLAGVQEERRRLMDQLDPERPQPMKLTDLAQFMDAEERPLFRATVTKLAGMAGELNSMNNLNKQFIEEALDTVEHLMGMLTSGVPNPVYGASGPKPGASAPRILAREV